MVLWRGEGCIGRGRERKRQEGGHGGGRGGSCEITNARPC